MQIEHRQTLEFAGRWPVEALRAALEGAQRVVLVSHTNADGDAVGSLLGVCHILRRNTKATVTPMLPDGCPADYDWLPGVDSILSGQADSERCAEAIAQADLVIGVDISGLSRTGCLEATLRQANNSRLLIDHHIGPEHEAFGLVVSEPDVSSACELVYWVTTQVWGPDALDRDVATCLFTGICTDTGTFSYSNDRPSVYHAAAALLAYGIDPMDINRRIKNIFSEARLRFFGFAIAERLSIYGDIALMVLTDDDMRSHGVESHELTGLINEVMRLKDTDCAILIREEAGKVRLSLRSKVHHDVNRLAKELFDGGGHEHAAGATSFLTLDETVEKVKKHLHLVDRPTPKPASRRPLLTALLLACLLSLTACREVPVVEADNPGSDPLKERLINANRLTAQSEETKIDAYVARRGWTMERLTGGARLMRTADAKQPPLGYEQTVAISYSVEDLGGNVIYKTQHDTIVTGHQEPTPGLDAAVRALGQGDEAVVILPSEQAYGVVGDGDRIGSRMVLVYKLKIGKTENKINNKQQKK